MDTHYEPQELLAALARDLQSDKSSEDAVKRVVECAGLVVPSAAAVGISIARRQQPPTTAASTHRSAEMADQLQVDLGEGPCFDAAWADPVVTSEDLNIDDRWPSWSQRMVDDADIRSLLCVRLFTHDHHIGALTLYAHNPNAYDKDDIDSALALAAHSAVAVAQAVKLEHLQTALDTRTVIGQAVGLIMHEHGLNSHNAFQVLLRLSSHQNRKLNLIAHEIVTKHDRDRDSHERMLATITKERTPPKPGPRDRYQA